MSSLIIYTPALNVIKPISRNIENLSNDIKTQKSRKLLSSISMPNSLSKNDTNKAYQSIRHWFRFLFSAVSHIRSYDKITKFSKQLISKLNDTLLTFLLKKMVERKIHVVLLLETYCMVRYKCSWISLLTSLLTDPMIPLFQFSHLILLFLPIIAAALTDSSHSISNVRIEFDRATHNSIR